MPAVRLSGARSLIMSSGADSDERLHQKPCLPLWLLLLAAR